MAHESSKISFSNAESIEARAKIFNSLLNYDATKEETERSLGLFIRGSLLARIFAIQEAYQLILGKPGYVFDIGTWRGQTAVICENLRAIYEPLNLNRKIVAFDTFTGYSGFSSKDKPTELNKDGTYGIDDKNYADFLKKLLELHEQSNAMGNNFGKHKVIMGDCRETISKFFDDEPNSFVSLAFIDVNSYEPTAMAIEKIWTKLIPNGIIAIWQLTRDRIPAEGNFYANEFLDKHAHEVTLSKTYPGLCFIKKVC